MHDARSTPPTVSFIVPCYHEGALLADCVRSILSQSYQDFEVLIMDDCSNRETFEVARSFRDSRVVHVRNEQNLGHLANYNKGIGLTRGRYLWLINADDLLGKPYIVERFVRLMESHPRLGLVCCPATKIQDGQYVRLIGDHGPRDAIFKSRYILKQFLRNNGVATPAGMVRRREGDQAALFPHDLPHAGDWYRWCYFASRADVGYLAEPMAVYRMHGNNMSLYYADRPLVRIADEFRVRWRLKEIAEADGRRWVVKSCRDALVDDYVIRVARKVAEDYKFGLTVDEFERSLSDHCRDPIEAAWIRRRVLANSAAEIADHYYHSGDWGRARELYLEALKRYPWRMPTLAKFLLLRLGNIGKRVRSLLTPSTSSANPAPSSG